MGTHKGKLGHGEHMRQKAHKQSNGSDRVGALEAGAGQGHREYLQGESDISGHHGGAGNSGGHGSAGSSGSHGGAFSLGSHDWVASVAGTSAEAKARLEMVVTCIPYQILPSRLDVVGLYFCRRFSM